MTFSRVYKIAKSAVAYPEPIQASTMKRFVKIAR